ncbi:hypothetical protein OESDEN_01344 [Oesophagostomum dentatum]|uniref:G-protein coupled receptors family 1 profile domain-containing protein n=1 Tax=Oesophagostomum dentatum TaxID=61180 RepID=A0A0B1TTF3_OESDE|nr:hypothetical protein OESDEN_01344 [Oesophagostomum dentatum]
MQDMNNGSNESAPNLYTSSALPVLLFLPPTEEPSSMEIAISVALVGCLTIAICGNASQIVLQIYTKRLTTASPSQFFIGMLLLINFLVPLGLPSIVLEKLVKIWMFGRLSCIGYYTLATAGRVLPPWAITVLHAFVAIFVSRSNRFSKFEGLLSLFGLGAMLFLIIAFVIPEGMTAELELIRKDEIEAEQYIMLIHTYQCSMNQSSNIDIKFGLEYVMPLILGIALHIWIRSAIRLNSQSDISKNLLYLLSIYYVCHILYYIPTRDEDFFISILPDDTGLRQILPFLAPTIMWYPLSQLSAALARSGLDKIEDDRTRARTVGRNTLPNTDIEHSHLMDPEIVV